MAATQRRTYAQNTYIEGNTVRRMEAAPDYRRERKERLREEEKRSRQHAARRNQERALLINRGYVAFLTMAVIITAMASVGYIKLQSNITSHMKSISTLESQLEDIKADNAAAQKRINTAIDLNHIKDVAVNELGMVYASESQIVYYSIDNNDYMNQYEDIPAN